MPTNPNGHSPTPSLSGILVLDKPLRMTSMTAVSIVRRSGGGIKTGHAGTLDPLASGVLVIAMGAATKFIDQLMNTDKRYESTIDLSAFTTTDDLEGERSEIETASPPNEVQVRDALKNFVGTIMQQPPAFSAVKIDGKRSYKLARQGNAVQAAARQVIVHGLELVRYAWPIVELRIHCAKGFYVRSLARDLGGALGTGGHCTAIRRTAVGPFTLAMARRIDDVPSPLQQADLISIDGALRMIDG